MKSPLHYAIAVLLLFNADRTASAQIPPSCRLDEEGGKAAATTIRLAMKAYEVLGKPLPFDEVIVNPTVAPPTPKSLAVYVVTDATMSTVNKKNCVFKKPAVVQGEELDPISISGGCVAAAGKMEVRCSSEAVQMFGKQGERTGLANPALLYVLAHELGHILQRRPGEYAGRVEPIELKQPQAAKLDILRESCEPGLTKAEEDADQLAVQVLVKLLPEPPYREPLFSAQGSVLWGADQLNLAANSWRKATLEREFISQHKPHKSFVPTEFPTPTPVVQANAKRFVCEVLTRKSGVVNYPGRSSTHPTLERRMQRVAEALRPLATGLPKSDAKQEYRSIAVLQEQLSDIFTFMYRETGVYLEALQSNICSRVNSDKPTEGC
ncbi:MULTISPECIES: hypothetical protein [Methylomonas]|uniref:Peptidase M48 domain-containing protein n=2 Tax=Methylomonas TaxID=416 RepID=A0A140E7A6_9GAMM|nr:MULTISPECIES: hypothetical protein [Methylomonas]AMK79280.1 hypothetical protein JT25_022800 [Methylomonas denitrificans]OAI03285.1 hypothetical protein A1342_09255 [Methylomonas methanica]TCV86201.1 hypothetical protein EDE11_104145 [Methylomonas methanica]